MHVAGQRTLVRTGWPFRIDRHATVSVAVVAPVVVAAIVSVKFAALAGVTVRLERSHCNRLENISIEPLPALAVKLSPACRRSARRQPAARLSPATPSC